MSAGCGRSEVVCLSKTTKTRESNLFQDILTEVRTKQSPGALKSILVLGDSGAGKTTLVSKLFCIRKPKVLEGSVLQFTYLDTAEDNQDDHTKLCIWMLNTDSYDTCASLVRCLPASIGFGAIVLVASIENPWNLIDTLQKLVGLCDVFASRSQLQDCNGNTDYWRESAHSKTSTNGSTDLMNCCDKLDTKPSPSSSQQLPSSIGSMGCNIPLTVVITQTDKMMELEKNYGYSKYHWDFIQCHVRKFCVLYDATLFYTSAINISDTNSRLLYQYLKHLCCGLLFKERDQANDSYQDQIFIPAGWDNEMKIDDIFNDVILHLKCGISFNDLICRPDAEEAEKDVIEEVTAEENQEFLTNIVKMIDEPLPISQLSSTFPTIPAVTSPATQESPRRRKSLEPLRKSAMLAAAARAAVVTTSVANSPVKGDASLHDFFHSLLRTKPGLEGPSTAPAKCTSSSPPGQHTDTTSSFETESNSAGSV